MKGWYQEQQEMERAANKATRGCGLLALIIALIIAVIIILYKLFSV